MTRYVAEISYNGALFHGWQVQSGHHTVQQALEETLSMLNGAHVNVAGAGRTDSGVHARGQVCSFDMLKRWDERRLILALNSNLKGGVSAVRLNETRPDFHARFDALSREYIYFIWTGSSIYPHLIPVTHWIKGYRHDWGLAAEACGYLEGEHDFGNFCRISNRPQDAVRTIYSAKLRRRGRLLWFRIRGSGFLTNMVRIIMGNLELVAKKERAPEWIKELVEAGNANTCGGHAFPPAGLFLWRIYYGESPWNSHERAL